MNDLKQHLIRVQCELKWNSVIDDWSAARADCRRLTVYMSTLEPQDDILNTHRDKN